MPLRQRSSGNPSRGTPQGPPTTQQPASTQPAATAARDSPPTPSARPEPVVDDSERLLAALTELNKVNAERDKLQALYDGVNKKLSEANRAVYDLKAQTQAFKEDNQAFKEDNQTIRERFKLLKEDHERITYEKLAREKSYTELKARYENLNMKYNAAPAPSPDNPMTGQIPERPKLSRSSSKRESRETRESREPREDRDRDRGRGREKDREKREQHKEQKAEKERLSKRFEERRAPPTANRRKSFIEPWGPGGRSSSANPTSRAFNNVATGRKQGPAFTATQQAAYSSVPRTSNPLSPGLYSSSGSGSSAVYDDETYEDGNYHPYPIAR